MRIVAGQFRGRRLSSVGKGDAAAHLRPTTDRVREALFGMLEGGRFGDVLTNARVLDLFAGTGALGLEALSRGAAHVTFVENGRVGGRLLTANIAKAGVAEACSVLRRDATRLGACDEAACGLVFLDPPYGKALGTAALKAVVAGGWLAPGALVVWEDNREADAPGFERLEARRYGETWITLLTFDG